MKSLENALEKNNVLTDGLERRYVQDVFEKRLDMDGVTPIMLAILKSPEWGTGTGFCFHENPIRYDFENRSWVGLLEEVANYLQENEPKTNEELLNFRVDWTSAVIFSEKKSLANMARLDCGLYLNLNHGAIHSSWLVGELLSFYGINYGTLVVHRPSRSEPQEVVEALKGVRLRGFKNYLLGKVGVSDEKADKIVNTINGVFNRILKQVTSYFDDFFLFDSVSYLSNYKTKAMEYMVLNTNFTEGQLNTAKKYLGYLTDYFTTLYKESKNHREDLELIIPII